MTKRSLFARLAIPLTVTLVIASQIPGKGVAIAEDGYGSSDKTAQNIATGMIIVGVGGGLWALLHHPSPSSTSEPAPSPSPGAATPTSSVQPKTGTRIGRNESSNPLPQPSFVDPALSTTR